MAGLLDGPLGANYLDQLEANFNPRGYEAYRLGQERNATYNMLMSRHGMTPELAAGMAMNPQALGMGGPAFMPQQPELLQIPGAFGGETQFYKKQVGPGGQLTVEQQPVTAPGGKPAAGPSGEVITPSNRAPGGLNEIAENIKQLKGKGADTNALLAALDKQYPAMGEMMRSIVEGREIPTHLSMRKDLRDAAIQLAPIIDPTYDTGIGLARIVGNKDWRTGKGAESQRALNQSMNHIANGLIPAAENLPGHMVPAVNSLENMFRTNVLGQGQERTFKQWAHTVSDEVGKIWKQNNLSDTEIRKWEENLPENMSRSQQHDAIGALMNMIRGGQEELEAKRLQAVGQMGAAKIGPMLSKTGQDAYDKIQKWLHPQETGQGVGSNPQGGLPQEIRKDPKTGNLYVKGPNGQPVPYKP